MERMKELATKDACSSVDVAREALESYMHLDHAMNVMGINWLVLTDA
jgi:hypothetical protein